MNKYQPQTFESKWIEQWDKEKTYNTGDKKGKKMYVLVMFPYPSGAGLHVGHVRVYTGTDVLARYFRMKGHSVLHPMGWDAFGLPAENAAVKEKKNPIDIVPRNIATFKKQMRMIGASYDWSREFTTTDPNYYKWTQWLFIQFFKMGLLYKKNTPVYYCEFCKTGLAEEEVLPNGTHERCGKPITRRELPQWIFRITTYADRLLHELDGLDWPAGILDMQRNWIGRKEGINITYKIKGKSETVTCFTTTPVNYGATFIVIAPEHPLVKTILSSRSTTQEYSTKIKNYVDKAVSKTDLERQTEEKNKTGVFTGLYAINHLTGEELPIWVSDFVLSTVGTGAVQGCPGHDERDFEFATKFGLPIKRVVTGHHGETGAITKPEQVVARGSKGIMVNSDFLNGIEFGEAMQKTMNYFEEKGWGKRVVSYHLRDWIFSRQRYWGEPMPLVFCQKCADNHVLWWDTQHQKASKVNKDVQENLHGWFPLDEKSLPLELPYLKSYEPSETGESPLAAVKEWTQATCPNCGGVAQRETDTMPNWAGSCWYFLRFADPHNNKAAWSNSDEAVKQWLPVDWYIGGAEHAVLHLLYSRFWVKALQDLKLIDFNEPFLRLRNVGMVLAEDHRKMSKSWGNVINPDAVVGEYGADALRLYEMFMAPFNQENAWSTSALQGTYRFLKRVWDLVVSHESRDSSQKTQDEKLIHKLNKTIQKVSSDITEIKYNTAVAIMMEFVNEWEEGSRESRVLSRENVMKFLQILAPFAPFMTEELWRTVLKEKSSIHLSSWPKIDKASLRESETEIPVQVNGKVRSIVTVSVNADEKTVVSKALKDKQVQKFIEGKKYKTIYVKGRVLNFVLQ